jgi:hypothetical protein
MIAALLPLARRLWSDITDRVYPIYGSIDIVEKADASAVEVYQFYTDLKRIYVCLNRPDELEDSWLGEVLPLYRASAPLLYPGCGAVPDADLARELWLDTLVFLLFHELYHPLVCPSSRQDERAGSLALYRGLRACRPDLVPRDWLRGTGRLKNLVWDLVVNVTFLARLAGADADLLKRTCAAVFSRAGRRLGQAAITSLPPSVTVALYYLSARSAQTDLLISIMGALYSLLCAASAAMRQALLDAFRAEGQRLQAPRPADQLALELLYLLLPDGGSAVLIRQLQLADQRDQNTAQRDVLLRLAERFEHPRERYAALEQVSRFLAPFLRGPEPQGSLDPATAGHGRADMPCEEEPIPGDCLTDTLGDLLEVLPEQEAEELLGSVLVPGDGEGGPGDDSAGQPGWTPLTLAAADAFYRKHARPLHFRHPHSRIVPILAGQRQQWHLRRVHNLTASEVTLLDLERLFAFQTATGLPVLLQLNEGHYLLHDFVLRRTRLPSYRREAGGVEIPDNWILLVDSSGSMGNPFYVNTGEKYDLLMRICYGMARGLAELGELLGKKVHLGVVNFSSSTTFTGMVELGRVLADPLHTLKRTLLIPQCGGTTLAPGWLPQVTAALKPGRSIATLITDGEIDNAPEVLATLDTWSREPEHAAVLIEIGVASALGEQLRQLAAMRSGIACFQVEKVEEIESVLGSMLVRYPKEK